MTTADEEAVRTAADLLATFVERTSPAEGREETRYLWTDAFAVCAFLSLAREADGASSLARALDLVRRVHHRLGRHRSDDTRRGFLSGLSGDAAEQHPTAGGLRIGKPLPERREDEPFDSELEWDRDGQYFHYLTKWMHALDQVSRATRDGRYHRYASELALVAHRAFVVERPGARARRMVWKMSTDLSRPLVSSMGQHDPLDGLVTCLQLQANPLAETSVRQALGTAISDFAAMVEAGELVTTDPLGLGGLLSDAYRLAQLESPEHPVPSGLLERVLDEAAAGLAHYARSGEPAGPASERLAFRELGLAIGLGGIERLDADLRAGALPRADRSSVRRIVAELLRHAPLGRTLTTFWLDPAARRARTWLEHRDIDEVMLATSLVPEGFLRIG